MTEIVYPLYAERNIQIDYGIEEKEERSVNYFYDI